MKNISYRTIQVSAFTMTFLLALFAQGQFAAAKRLQTQNKKEVAASKLSLPVSEAQRHLDEALLDAAGKNDTGLVQRLLEQGANPDCETMPPIIRCLMWSYSGLGDVTDVGSERRRHQKTIDLLLSHMKNVDARIPHGDTALV